MVRVQLLHLLALVVDLYLVVRILRRSRATVDVACAALCLCFAVWSASLLFAHDQAISRRGAELAYHVGALAWASFGSLTLLFVLIYVRASAWLRSPLVRAALLLPPLFVIGAQWAGILALDYPRQPWGYGYRWSDSPAVFFFYGYYALFCNIALGRLFWVAWRARDPLQRRQASWMVFSAAPSLVLASVTDVLLPRLQIYDIPNIGPDLILSWGIGLTWALSRHQTLAPTLATAAERIISTMSDALLLLDHEGRVLRTNAAAERLLGYQATELLASPASTILARPEEPRDPARSQGQIDIELQARDGRRIPALLSVAQLRDDDGRHLGAVWVAKDITDHKRAEKALREARDQLEARVAERTGELQRANEQLAHEMNERQRSEASYQTLIESMQEGVWRLDSSHRSVLVNQRLVEMLGEAGVARARQQPESLVSCEDRGRWQRLLDESRAGVRGQTDLRLELGGRRLSAIVSSAPLYDLEGRYDGVVLTFADVTERQQLQARLAQTDRMASVGLLAAGVAHEINNPMSFVLANLEYVVAELPAVLEASQDRTPLAEINQAASEALEGAARVREILKSLRTFSRVEDERLTPVSLDEAIAVALTMTHNQLKYRTRVERQLGAPPPVLASEGRIAQVFINLLINAAQAIEEGKVEDNCITLRSWHEHGWACAEVSDTGSGIDAVHQERLFEPFFTTKPVGENSGLGLAICQQIVSDFGGDISVKSQPGVGSTFALRLPVCGSGELRAVSTKERVSHRRTGRRARLLVIDDEDALRASIRRTANPFHEVVDVDGGAAAQALLAHDRAFDLLLCDLMMPEVSGMELYGWLRERHPELAERVVFMTGGVFTPAARELFARVDNARLDKPFSRDQLLDLLDAQLEHWVVGDPERAKES